MSLYELGCEYAESAELLRCRLKVLRAKYNEETDPYIKFHLDRRIRTLEPMLTECRKMATFLKRYYEPGFYIKDGAYGIRVRRTESVIEEDNGRNYRSNSAGTTNRRTVRNLRGVLCEREDDTPDSGGARR